MTFEYDSVRQRLMDSLKSKASWAEILFFSTNSRLVDSVSEAIAEFASYDEFLARNTRWDLASEKSALTSQARFMQYEPHRKIGSTGTIRFGLSAGFDVLPDDTIIIPKYSVFSNESGDTKFSTVSTQNMLTTDLFVDLKVIQGEPKTFSYIANGDVYEEISIASDSIENSLYEVIVNGETWTETSDINSLEKTEKKYKLENKLKFDGINIIFGNDIFGVKLQAGDSITFKYVETLGILGNILGVELVDTVESTIYDINSATIDGFCSNLDNLDGGQNEEDIEDIRTNGVNTFQAGDKAVSQKDYKIKLEQNEFIFKAAVWGAYEYNLDNNVDLWTYIPTEENFVNVSAFTSAGEQLSIQQQIDAIVSIKADKPPTDIVKFIDVNFIYLAFTIQAFAQDTSNTLSIIKTDIINSITTKYGVTSQEFRQPLYETDWKGLVNDVNGVTYHSSYVELVKFEVLNQAYLGDLNLDIYPISARSIHIYIRDNSILNDPYVLIAIDNGSGIFTPEAGYDLTGSSVNYTTGEGALNIVSGVTGDFSDKEIKTVYKPDAINTILNGRNQIFKVLETNVSAEYTVD